MHPERPYPGMEHADSVFSLGRPIYGGAQWNEESDLEMTDLRVIAAEDAARLREKEGEPKPIKDRQPPPKPIPERLLNVSNASIGVRFDQASTYFRNRSVQVPLDLGARIERDSYSIPDPRRSILGRVLSQRHRRPTVDHNMESEEPPPYESDHYSDLESTVVDDDEEEPPAVDNQELSVVDSQGQQSGDTIMDRLSESERLSPAREIEPEGMDPDDNNAEEINSRQTDPDEGTGLEEMDAKDSSVLELTTPEEANQTSPLLRCPGAANPSPTSGAISDVSPVALVSFPRVSLRPVFRRHRSDPLGSGALPCVPFPPSHGYLPSSEPIATPILAGAEQPSASALHIHKTVMDKLFLRDGQKTVESWKITLRALPQPPSSDDEAAMHRWHQHFLVRLHPEYYPTISWEYGEHGEHGPKKDPQQCKAMRFRRRMNQMYTKTRNTPLELMEALKMVNILSKGFYNGPFPMTGEDFKRIQKYRGAGHRGREPMRYPFGSDGFVWEVGGWQEQRILGPEERTEMGVMVSRWGWDGCPPCWNWEFAGIVRGLAMLHIDDEFVGGCDSASGYESGDELDDGPSSSCPAESPKSVSNDDPFAAYPIDEHTENLLLSEDSDGAPEWPEYKPYRDLFEGTRNHNDNQEDAPRYPPFNRSGSHTFEFLEHLQERILSEPLQENILPESAAPTPAPFPNNSGVPITHNSENPDPLDQFSPWDFSDDGSKEGYHGRVLKWRPPPPLPTGTYVNGRYVPPPKPFSMLRAYDPDAPRMTWLELAQERRKRAKQEE